MQNISQRLADAVDNNGGEMPHNELVAILDGDERAYAKTRFRALVAGAGLTSKLVRAEDGKFNVVYVKGGE